MLMFKASTQRMVRDDVSLQTYRDDNGPHLAVMLPGEGRTITLDLTDSECGRLAKALDSIAEDAPF